MSKVTILHISDLHLANNNLRDVRVLVSKLQGDLKRLHLESGLSPDLFIFSGDFIQKGEDAQESFRIVAGDVVDPILGSLRLSQEFFFTVPGNHEVNRKKVYQEIESGLEARLTCADSFESYYKSLDPSDQRFAAIAEKLSGYSTFARSYPSQFLRHQSFFSTAAVVPVSGINVGIVGLNSAWRSSQFGAGDHGRLIVGKPVIEDALPAIEHADLKIAVCHHPFNWLAEWDQTPVQRTVAREFDILFNGHVHDSEASLFQQSFGAFYTSTCGCLRSGSHFSHYSVVEIDLAKGEVIANLRKWYEDRHDFDQETAKAKHGRVVFGNFRSANPEILERLKLSEIRSQITRIKGEAKLVNPLEGVAQLTLDDVFVEPLLCDTSSLKRTGEPPKSHQLEDLLHKDGNLIFYGRPECGKSSLLAQAFDWIIQDEGYFGEKLPILTDFSELPKNNPNGVAALVCRALGNEIDAGKARDLLSKGAIILLVDDFGDRLDPDFQKRIRTFSQFLKQFPKVRIIATITEHIKQSAHPDLMVAVEDLKSTISYIWPFNAAKIRQLLTKVSVAKSIDVNRMLEQIVFYFQQLQIPVTPLAVTLFIGVLFRDPNQRNNIQNEAYLIENYLESILEKLSPSPHSSQLDFRDKESFLSFIALRMMERNSPEFSELDFERNKVEHFAKWGESLPSAGFFEDFFKKGILQRDEGRVSFKFRFWFSFFLAKAMEKSEDAKRSILARNDFLRFSTALAYKAGLSRNDIELLSFIDDRLAATLGTLITGDVKMELETTPLDIGLKAIGDSIEADIKAKNTPEIVDANADAMLTPDEEPSDSDGIGIDEFSELLTLHSDILRNTREIAAEIKEDMLRRNVCAYSSFMFLLLHEVKSIVSSLNVERLAKLLFPKTAKKQHSERLKRMLRDSQKLISQVIPVSIVLYMTDRLGNPKLTNIVSSAAAKETRDVEKLFYLLLLYKLDPAKGAGQLRAFLADSKSSASDFIAALFLRIYAQEHLLEDENVDKLIEILVNIRDRHSKYDVNRPVHIADTYRSDLRKQFLLAHSKKD